MERAKRPTAAPLDVKTVGGPIENDSDLRPEADKPPIEPDDTRTPRPRERRRA